MPIDDQTLGVIQRRNPPDYLGCYCNSPRFGWIVAVTHPQAEPWAETNLRRRGYCTFLPRCAVRRRDPALRTLTHIILVPLWPGYIFVQHDNDDSWRPIYETPGIRSVLKHHDQIQYLPHGIVEALQATEAARSTIHPPTASWTPGAPCRLSAGPFSGHDAVVVDVLGERIRVGVMLFGAMQAITVSPAQLIPREDTR